MKSIIRIGGKELVTMFSFRIVPSLHRDNTNVSGKTSYESRSSWPVQGPVYLERNSLRCLCIEKTFSSFLERVATP